MRHSQRPRDLTPNDVFTHPRDWERISRATAIAVYWRIPIIVVPSGGHTSSPGEWFDDHSRYFADMGACSSEPVTFYRYKGPVTGRAWSPPALVPPVVSEERAPAPPTESKYWIRVCVVDEFGDPVPHLAVRFHTPKRGETVSATEANGVAVANDTGSGKIRVSLANNLYFTDESSQGTAIKPGERKHTLRARESISSVARAAGLFDGRTIYYYTANSDLRSKRAALGLVAVKDQFVIPAFYAFEFPAKPDGEEHEYRVKVPALLDITSIDAHFAPSQEDLDIAYETQLLSRQTVKLEISSPHLEGGAPFFKHDLTADEKTDGVSQVFHWDGKANEGKLKGKYLSPLYSPYKVKLYVPGKAKHQDEQTFSILYHSIEIDQGPWTYDEKMPTAGSNEWVTYALNSLGYWAGPVHSDTLKYREKAIIRYRLNHPKLHKSLYPDYTGTIDQPLKDAIKEDLKNGRGRLSMSGNAINNPKGESKIYVEALTYQRKTATTNEFTEDKTPYEKDRLNRPLIPLEAHIFLKGKPSGSNDGPRKDAPEAIGPVRIDWHFSDTAEDTKGQYEHSAPEPSYTRKYLDKSFKLKGGGPGGDNCHVDFNGARENAPDYKSIWLLDKHFEPHEAKDDAGNAVYTLACCADDKKYANRVGKAGIFFRPSYVAGDSYRLSAEINFKGLPNKADLETLHGIKDKIKIRAYTGHFRIWRTARIAAVIDWPARTNGAGWDQIRTDFEKAYMEVDTGGAKSKVIADYLSDAEYKSLVTTKTANTDPTKITYYPDAMFGVATVAQGVLESLSDYITHINTDVCDNYWDKIAEPIREKIEAKVRATDPTGFVVLNFLAHKPIDLTTNNTFAVISTEKATHKDLTNPQSFIKWIGSEGKADAHIFIDEKDPDKPYYVVAHEMGHCLYLRHHEVPVKYGPTPTDHDTDDHNCLMSYSDNGRGDPHQVAGVFTPHFCGKCNLSLRGWGIRAPGILPSSS